ncbi:MAG: glycosyltransferase [Planctomycetaceae bacterium]|nr:glycosyltransferase [Planctomycetaceae bacterium]MBN8603091.1 glycosyltransferase [Planctomycetota bacterium]
MSQESISVVLPLKDAQVWLKLGAEDLLECLGDLGVRFEVIFVDNGSTDFTAEVIDELRRQYPQVQSIRLKSPRPAAEAVQLGVERSIGEIIFVQEMSAPIRVSDLLRLWALRADKSLLMARAQTSARRVDEQWLQRLMPWSKRFTDSWNETQGRFSGLQMLRRSGLRSISKENPTGQLEVAHISHHAVAPPKFAESIATSGTRFGVTQ